MAPGASPRFGPAGRAARSSTTPGVVVVTDGEVAAVLDHSASPTQIYCAECLLEALGSTSREELTPSQIGDVLICDSCGRDISELVDDPGTVDARGGGS